MRRTNSFPLFLILIFLTASLRFPTHPAAAAESQPPDQLAVADYIPPAMTTVTVMGDYAYVGAGNSLMVIDVSDPDHPQRVAYRLLPDPVVQVVAESGRVYVLTYYYSFTTFSSSHSVWIFNVGEPASPRLIANLPEDVNCIAVEGMKLYLGDSESFRILFSHFNI